MTKKKKKHFIQILCISYAVSVILSRCVKLLGHVKTINFPYGIN